MAPLLRAIVIFSTLISSVITVPTSASCSHTSLEPVTLTSRHKPAGPFRRLRDAIIESIWSIPSNSASRLSPSTRPAKAPETFRARYGSDVVLRFQVKTQEEAIAISEAADVLYLDIWEATNGWVDIRIAKEVVPSFVGLLPASLHDAYVPLIQNVARAVYDTYPDSSPAYEKLLMSSFTGAHDSRLKGNSPHDLFFQDYQPLSVLYPWLRLLASLFPEHASLTSIGTSAEGRNIPALRIGSRVKSSSADSHDTRQTLLIVGGSHAREWISVSTVAFIAYSLVTRYGHPQFHEVTKILDHFDLVFIPVLNPDGYEYTWASDRLWRKNRQSTSIPFCPGIDLDRSFRFGWDGHGNRDNACSDDYAGPEPLAAVEAQVLSQWAQNETSLNNVTFMSYLDFHSYSQEVLYPYSYTCETAPPNLEDLEEVALGIAKSFRLTNGHFYNVDSACEGDIAFQSKTKQSRNQIEAQGGSALDFFYHDMGVKLAYQIKLRDTGTYGFLLPRSHILPTGQEAYEAVVGLGRYMLGNHGIESITDPNSVWGEEKESAPQQKTNSFRDSEMPLADEEGEYEADDYDFELRRRRRR
ncbi:putative metallocarboxypeptidase ecm14 [Cladophialophora chaetospira]|uniref:Inactive metallocarboxypeptidase ECM14 n=1 Tax=Cladophialophora chaetospira TaxID=386627 RepID=A0AA38XMS8_9EURO|nr:putative metallocarboxypeptidase ecm14 [Cladophialophora chaetospira]